MDSFSFDNISREFDQESLALNQAYFGHLSELDRVIHFRIALAVLSEEYPTDDPWPANPSIISLSRVLTRPEGLGDIQILRWAKGPESLTLPDGQTIQLPAEHMGAVVKVFYMDTHAVNQYYIQVPPELLDRHGRIHTSDFRLLRYDRPDKAD